MVRQVRSVTEKSQKSPKTWVVVFVSWVRFGGAKERRRSLPPHCAPLSGRLAGGGRLEQCHRAGPCLAFRRVKARRQCHIISQRKGSRALTGNPQPNLSKLVQPRPNPGTRVVGSACHPPKPPGSPGSRPRVGGLVTAVEVTSCAFAPHQPPYPSLLQCATCMNSRLHCG